MIGPIFDAELQRCTRRGHLIRLRYAYATWLFLQFLFMLSTAPA